LFDKLKFLLLEGQEKKKFRIFIEAWDAKQTSIEEAVMDSLLKLK